MHSYHYRLCFLNLLIIRWVQILHRIIEHQLRKFATNTKNLKENHNFRIFVSNKSLSSLKLPDMNLPVPMSQANTSQSRTRVKLVLSAQHSTFHPKPFLVIQLRWIDYHPHFENCCLATGDYFWYSHRSDSSEDSVTAWRSALLTGPHRIANVDWKLKHSK